MSDQARDESLWILALAILAVIAPVVLGVVVLTGMHDTDVHLSDAARTGHRLDHGQVDDRLTSDLIALQQDETALFQRQVDYGGLTSHDPHYDVGRVEADLAVASGPVGDSARARTDLTTIADELPPYTEVEATAVTDNQQGKPVGAAYLRAGFGYLKQQILPKAADIREIEQNRLRADTGQADGFPWLLVTTVVVVLGCLVLTHEVLASRTHRRFNAGVLIAGALILLLGAGAIATNLASGHDVETRVRSQTDAAVRLTKVRDDADRAELDDELTLADHDEDCTTSPRPPFTALCDNEQDAQGVLKTGGPLVRDLEAVRSLLPASAQTAPQRWYTAEGELPILQNLSELANKPSGGKPPLRYGSSQKLSVLDPYTDPSKAPSTSAYFASVNKPTMQATKLAWSRYTAAVRDARGGLGTLAWAGLFLGLAAGLAAGLGCRPRVVEYWSRGEDAA
ncbi:hypothetical protein [Streptantibioticus silvisoli]|uniref:Secreted protein n=1 Tax=Streptantibioticus silvisoli TaxID=2705255 RepID=A0ABT6VY15_9ACTN|nr:hypothetical protein [Streptantibioticus silvisoli]MDI5963371.1 hypothetical protein [Streptantibioticus silvisoli]